MKVLRRREEVEAEEALRLGAWAVKAAESRGRVYPEAEHEYRTAFQRDRDRIVHSRAFRRLEYKTQVFVFHEGDHYRNRLTHTLEASQISRTLARILRLNEDLAEAVALAHDLGHTPFGHAGEDVLDRLLGAHGGFDHNRQTLRIVDLLEERYPRFRGLNLTQETREGILKHGAPWEHPVPLPAAAPSRSLEAQVADCADEIAYTNHDLDDGLRAGLLTLEGLRDVALWRETHDRVVSRHPEAPQAVRIAQTIVFLINRWVTDLGEATAARIEALAPADVEAVRASPEPLVRGSGPMHQGTRELKEFLRRNFYHHPHVVAATRQAVPVLEDLFAAFRADPGSLPAHVVELFEVDGEERAIADYIAGMTDRFAMEAHRVLEGKRRGS